MRLLFLFISIVFLSNAAYSTHLIGGNLGYEYVGKFGTDYRFKIILTTYTDCAPPSNFQTGPEQVIEDIGVYEHDLQNSPMQGASVKNFLANVNMTLVIVERIDPNIPNNCTIGSGTCIDKAVYEGFVDLPLNFTGYHIFYERCCRNGSIVNLVPQESMSFHAYISPPLLGNSSPAFTDDPIPFLCAGDTTTILNSAFDPDGDLLVFSFVQPYDAQASSDLNPAPGPPGSLNWTINTVTYAGGYSLAQPFGTGGYTSINASTGLTTYYPPATGDYVVAVEIKEYRNGNLIGVTRRDLQLLVLNCPPNPAPNIDPAAGTTSNQFTIEEGETLCFDFGYNDPNGDSLTLTASGAVFSPLYVNPVATINQPVTGLDTVSTEFCWTTACGQAQNLPYQFQVSVADNGCPPKTTNSVYQITVDPVAPPNAIAGDDIVCQFSTGTYSTQNISNTSYNWTVTGGNITANNGNSIDIQWTAPGTGTISLIAENQFGCLSAPITEDITVTIAPNVDAGVDTTICFGDTVFLSATTDALPGFSTNWTPVGNIINSTSLTPSVFPTDTTEYLVTIDIGGGCFGLDSVIVNVNIPFVSAGPDTSICLGDSVQLNGSTSTGNILWTPSTDLSNDAILNPFASPTINSQYILSLTDGLGCVITDTMNIIVDPGFTLTTSNDTTICLGDCANLSASGATSYAWEPATTLNDSTLSNPTACPTVTETYFVYGATGICRDTAQITVTISAVTVVNAGLDVAICFGDTTQLNASGATVYLWTPSDSITDINIANPFVYPSTTTTYIVTGTDGLGCPDTDSVIITVNPLPTVDAGEDLWVCPGDNIQINGSGSDSPVWSPIIGLSDPNIFTPNLTPLDTTEYILTVTDINLCTLTDTMTVFVNANVPTDAGNDTIICSGDSVLIGGNPTAIGGTTYAWSPAGVIVDPSVANPIVFPNVTTTFYVTTTNDTCTGIDSVIVNVNVSPTINAGNDIQICIGDSAQLLATGGASYLWTPSSTLTNDTIDNPIAFPTDTTEYIVSAIDINGCTNSDTVSVIVNPLPSANAGNDITICSGDTTTLTATGGLTYNWSPTDSLSNPINNTTQAFPIITTEYIVTITDTNGCLQFDSVVVTVNALPNVGAGLDASICIGDSTQLNAVGGNTYIWTPTTDLSNPNIFNPWASPTANTNYIVETTDVNNCSSTDTVLITVNLLPIISAGNDVTICAGDSAQLSATGGTSYLWIPPLTLTNDAIANPFAFPVNTTDYVVSGTDVNGCINTDTVSVNVNPLPPANAGSDIAICFGDTTTLTATGGQTYSWSPQDSLSNPNNAITLAYPSLTTEYIVSVTDINGCIQSDSVVITVNGLPDISAGLDVAICIGDSTQLNAIGGDTYVWTPTIDLSNPNIANPWASSVATTNYSVLVTDANGCTDTDTVLVTVNNLPSINAGNDTQICIGDSTLLNVTGGDTYLWTPENGLSSDTSSSPLVIIQDTTEYIVFGTDGNGCINSDTVTIVVNPLPIANAGNDANICTGDATQLTATGGTNYTWLNGTFLDNDAIFNPIATPDTTMEFIVTVSDSNNCIHTDSVIVNVFRIDAIPDQNICIGDSVQLDVYGSIGSSYTWTPSTYLSNPNIANPYSSAQTDITYYVSVSDVQGCTDQDSVSLVVLSAPMASFTSEIEAGCDGAIVEFTNTSTDGFSFDWIFGDGGTSTEENPTYVFPYGDAFTANLIVTNTNGCVDTTSFSGDALGFDDYFDIFIPNVFTPNGDGENDIFEIRIAGQLNHCTDMKIYNRWGQIMFISTGGNTKWDGHTNVGVIVPEGTYFFVIEINDKVKSGTIMVFR